MEIINVGRVGDLERFDFATCLPKYIPFCRTKYVATCAINFIKDINVEDIVTIPVEKTFIR